jgi:hypothetical protein
VDEAKGRLRAFLYNHISELERRAKLTRNRISDVQRYRAKLTAEEFERVYDVLRTILPPE